MLLFNCWLHWSLLAWKGAESVCPGVGGSSPRWEPPNALEVRGRESGTVRRKEQPLGTWPAAAPEEAGFAGGKRGPGGRVIYCGDDTPR